MPGIANASNLYGRTQYIVDPTAGAGAGYTSVQDAYDAAVAGGVPAVIMLKAGTYTEDLTLPLQAFGIQIVSAAADGRLPFGNAVIVTGHHTFTGLGAFIAENINFTDSSANPMFEWTSPGTGGLGLIGFQECGLFATGAGESCIDMTATGADFIVLGPQFGDFQSDGNNIATSGGAVIISSASNRYTSSSGGNFLISSTGGQITCSRDDLTCSTGNFLINDAGPFFQVEKTNVTSQNQACIQFSAAATFICGHSTIISADAGGEFVTGTGTLIYGNLLLPGTAQNIAATVTESPVDWKPYATANTQSLAVRGTSAFNNVHFTDTNGWISLASPPTLTWSDQAAPTTVAANTGSFSTASIALTLPSVVSEGVVCGFVNTFGASLTVTANAGQEINIAGVLSATAGTAVSSVAGESLTLVYRAADSRWYSTATNGSWVVT